MSQREQYDLLVFHDFEVLAVLLATHFNGQPLTVDHGAPLRLLVPSKLGLKGVKAITKITIPRKSRETTGLNMDIPVTTESNTPAYRTAVY